MPHDRQIGVRRQRPQHVLVVNPPGDRRPLAGNMQPRRVRKKAAGQLDRLGERLLLCDADHAPVRVLGPGNVEIVDAQKDQGGPLEQAVLPFRHEPERVVVRRDNQVVGRPGS